MKSISVITVILICFVIESSSNWCIEKKPIKITQQFPSFHRSPFHRRDPYWLYPSRTYTDYALERVCCFGYRQNNDICEAICEPECPLNSTCFKPNVCHCDNGYYGHDEAAHSIVCRPYCSNPCPLYSECIEPNKCHCQNGYHESKQHTCEPTCSQDCGPNSYCKAPDVCVCNYGYELIENFCHPICEHPCPVHSHCTEPNKCRCIEGYQMKMTSLYEHYCEPICEPACINGICKEPNKCTCFSNYRMNDNGSACEPICQNSCVNGKCIAPDMCACNEGYSMGPEKTCQAICEEPCQMGKCIEPNQCQCMDGYALKINSTSICEPICDPQCENGVCLAPNSCICYENYAPSDTNFKCIAIAQTETTTATSSYEVSTTVVDSTTIKPEEDVPQFDRFKSATTESPENETTTPVYDECLQNCECWQEADSMGALPYTKCIHFCKDQPDQTCLDIALCSTCKNGQLFCKTMDQSDANEPLLVLDCKKWHNLTVPLQNTAESNQSILNTKSTVLWLIVGGIFILIVLSSLMAYLYFRRVNYGIQYDRSN